MTCTFHVARSNGGWSRSVVSRRSSVPRNGVVRGGGAGAGAGVCAETTPLIVSDARISFRIEEIGDEVHEHEDDREKQDASLNCGEVALLDRQQNVAAHP